jgi:hypothetical protein
MNTPFFLWAEPLLTDDPDLRDYLIAGGLPPDPHLALRLEFLEMLYDLELEAGLLKGGEMEWD